MLKTSSGRVTYIASMKTASLHPAPERTKQSRSLAFAHRSTHSHPISVKSALIRNPEKGAFARGALRKFVANCAPNLHRIAGVSFRASEEGCAKLSQICREFEGQFLTILCKYPRETLCAAGSIAKQGISDICQPQNLGGMGLQGY